MFALGWLLCPMKKERVEKREREREQLETGSRYVNLGVFADAVHKTSD